MSQVLVRTEYAVYPEKGQQLVVVVGAGPVGTRVAQLLLNQNNDMTVVLYGDEPWQPYNRFRLSSILAGKADFLEVSNEIQLADMRNLVYRSHCRISEIDPVGKTVTEETGRVQGYDRLILATGARPRMPEIKGIELKGIYTFRNLHDLESLQARQVRSRRTVILGGGILGIESARAMKCAGTEVTIIEHTNRLMGRQLDDRCAELLREHIMTQGIRVYTGNSVAEIEGEDNVTAVLLRSGRRVECDTVILATGVTPNIELARKAWITVGRGIRVDDHLQTSCEDVFAIGECIEHRDRVYGQVEPGFEQAEVLAGVLSGLKNRYQGSTSASRLKVLGIPVFSMGRVGEEEFRRDFEELVYQDTGTYMYRKLVLLRGRLVGAIALGDWPEQEIIRQHIAKQKRIWWWQLRRFVRTGLLTVV